MRTSDGAPTGNPTTAAAQDTPPSASTGAQPKPATAQTMRVNALYRQELPFDNTTDFEDAGRGLIASLPEPIIRNSQGRPVWDVTQYDFVGTSARDDAPDTVNRSLWRMAKLNMFHGLFEVVEGIYQARGYDLSVMSIIRSDSGYIVIDPFISAECAATVWRQLVVPNLGDKPIVAVIHTHSHVDHYGGVRGIVSQADIDAGKVTILAPANFTEAVAWSRSPAERRGTCRLRRSCRPVGDMGMRMVGQCPSPVAFC